MTEYDFSPAAVERYKEKQRGISRWVQETQKHNPPNPISSRPQAYRSSTYNGNTPTRRPSSNNQSARPSMHRSHTDASRRPNMRQPTRSYTTPAAVARPMAPPPPPLQLYSAPPVYGPVIVSVRVSYLPRGPTHRLISLCPTRTDTIQLQRKAS